MWALPFDKRGLLGALCSSPKAPLTSLAPLRLRPPLSAGIASPAPATFFDEICCCKEYKKELKCAQETADGRKARAA